MASKTYSAYWENPSSVYAQYGKPADWDQYIASGGNPTSPTAYANWKGQNQRNLGTANFVDMMSQQNPQAQQNQQAYSADFGTAGNALKSYLNTSPTDAANIFQPYLTNTQSRITALLDNPDSINQSAAYKFRLAQGLEGVNRSMGAKGLLGSGNRLAALNDYAQGQASQEYGDQFNRLNSLLGTNTQGYLGEKNANTNAWQAKGSLLGNFYNTASNALNQNQQQMNSDRLGWGKLYSDISPKPQFNALTYGTWG